MNISGPRQTALKKLKTIIRMPVMQISSIEMVEILVCRLHLYEKRVPASLSDEHVTMGWNHISGMASREPDLTANSYLSIGVERRERVGRSPDK